MVVLAEKGIRASVMDDVALEAGVSHGTVYRYYDSIEDLLSAAGKALATETILRFEEAVAGFDDPARRVAGGMVLFLRTAEEYPFFARFRVNVGLQAVDPRDATGQSLPRHIAAGMKSGRFARTSVEAGLDLVLGAALMALARIASGATTRFHRERVVAATLMGLGLERDEALRLARHPYPMPPQAADSLLSVSRARFRSANPRSGTRRRQPVVDGVGVR